MRDACAVLTGPLVEVHISQSHAREAFRPPQRGQRGRPRHDHGLGVEGYRAACATSPQQAGQ
jgi:3-dehydroquinate dehydratase-2